MRLSRRLAAAIAWIANVAVLVAALAPALVHAQMPRGDAFWAEVCTGSGTRMLTGTPADPDSKAPAGHAQHGACCFLHASAPSLPSPPAAPALAAPLRYAEVPARFLEAPRTPHAWRRAVPRGPPSQA